MSVTVRRYRKTKKWEIDVVVTFPDGTIVRERRKSPVSSKSAAILWGRERERKMLTEGLARLASQEVEPSTEALETTFADLARRFLAGKSRLSRNTLRRYEGITKNDLLPMLRAKRLGEIVIQDVDGIVASLRSRGLSAKSERATLALLQQMLSYAVDRGELERIPFKIEKPVPVLRDPEWWQVDEADRILEAAEELGWRHHLVVALGLYAGLRKSEIRGRRWVDIQPRGNGRSIRVRSVRTRDFERDIPKGKRVEWIPITDDLDAILRRYRHRSAARSEYIVCSDDGSPLSENATSKLVEAAERLAGLPHKGTHALRHSFCSHLARAGVPARTIQRLARHASITMTMRYMHVAEDDADAAIRALDRREILEKDTRARERRAS